MGTRDKALGDTADKSRQPPEPMMRKWADRNIPVGTQRPGKVTITPDTKIKDTEGSIEHNPLNGRPKSA